MNRFQYLFFCVLAVVVFALSSTGFAQTSRCVVAEKNGSLVTLSCPSGTQVQNLGSAADLYRVGDSIDVSDGGTRDRSIDTRSQGVDPRTQSIDPRQKLR